MSGFSFPCHCCQTLSTHIRVHIFRGCVGNVVYEIVVVSICQLLHGKGDLGQNGRGERRGYGCYRGVTFAGDSGILCNTGAVDGELTSISSHRLARCSREPMVMTDPIKHREISAYYAALRYKQQLIALVKRKQIR
jgi:hypothetical protein